MTRFIAISSAVADRIRRHYGRTAPVIYPPVDVDRIQPRDGKREGFYLLTGGFVPYKRENLALAAFRELGAPLIVVGDGPMRKDLERRAPPNVSFLGRVSDAELAELYARCRALIYPQEEDFGIVAVEAQAAGAPVIAFGRGGATDTVVPIHHLTAGARSRHGGCPRYLAKPKSGPRVLRRYRRRGPLPVAVLQRSPQRNRPRCRGRRT